MVDSNTKLSPQIIRELFKALGNETRFKIFSLLMTGSQCNCELSKALGIPLNLVSHHTRILLNLGLVTAQRDSTDARWIHYSINQQELEYFRQVFMRVSDPIQIEPRSPECPPKACKKY